MSVSNQGGKEAWDKRATVYGSMPSGVLVKGFPPLLNDYLGNWHGEVILNNLLSKLPKYTTVLDLGCGYGRISAFLKKHRPDLTIIGLDFSFIYCQNYKKNINYSVVCADITSLPFKKGTFSAIIAVTVIMYLEEEQAQRMVTYLMSLLTSDGYFLMIEPSREYLTLAALLVGSTSSTGGKGFSLSFFCKLTNLSFVRTEGQGGMPGFSWFLPIMMLARNNPKFIKFILGIARFMDSRLSFIKFFSFHRWLLLHRCKPDYLNG
ncbi:MAG: class I SAM-dependent methyltransferase [Candidatus Contendobacter sp.]|nr:MAG: class I SAM-dependent methyltransferase [Candidatus Contendobacter sp.]